MGQALLYGKTVVLQTRFSASGFWNDCVRHKVTIAQYIIEICRYLLRQPHAPEERRHNIRAMIGNGLKPEIWQEFASRFNIKQISEIYGSTDGNCTMVNFDNRIGAVGFVPVWLQNKSPSGLIRLDDDMDKPLRSPETGLAIRCNPGEVGELVGKIMSENPMRDFPGYVGNDYDTNQKILNNVFHAGDRCFRTGKVLML